MTHPVKNSTSIHEARGSIPSLAQGVKDPVLPQLQHRSQTWLRTGVTVSVAEAGSHSSDSVPSLGTSICGRSGQRNGKKI